MDRIVNVQKDLQKSIEKGFVNFRKSPKDRITIEYLETRLENLERDWQLFHVNNSKLYESQTPEDIQSSIYSSSGLKELLDNTSDCLNALRQQSGQKDDPQASTSDNSSPIVTCLSTGEVPRPKQVLLATALLNLQSRSGDYQVVRALLDQGSQACFITEDAVQLLKLKKEPVRGVVAGLGESKDVVTKSTVNVIIQSRYDPKFKIPTKMFVLSKITSYLPEKHIEPLEWLNFAQLELADPQFYSPNKIDVLLGAEVYSQILNNGILKSTNNHLVAQSTKLGWILSGVLKSNKNSASDQSRKITVLHTQVTEDDCLKKFWEIEDQIPSTKKLLTKEEQQCEVLYKATTKRTEDGRYIVKLPFKDDVPSCEDSNSHDVALARFNSLEKRFKRDQDLKKKYTEVIEELLTLDHMRPVKGEDEKQGVYIPHHAVIRNDKTTTKVRVVVDASCKYNNGFSLNDTLLVGPTLQPELRHILLRWRSFGIGIVADIVKMYRQVRIAEEDVSFQRILRRSNSEDAIKEYEFLTVLFGTASAPYLAVKSLNQVAYDEGKNYPAAANRVIDSFYMDDLLSGTHTVEEGIELYSQMKELLTKGGFELQKWNSNSLELLKEINKNEMINKEEKKEAEDKGEVEIEQGKRNDDKEVGKEKDESKETMEIKIDSTLKILGLTWDRSDDVFQYVVKLPEICRPATKRSILSNIAKLFDPLGWLAPAVIVAKIFIQKLWLAGLDWDQELPDSLLKEWDTYCQELPRLTEVRIPRWLGTKNDDILAAYAAVIYLRRVDIHGNVHVSLLTAKTRVAPIRQVSIPRLELCAAVLLTRLLVEIMEVLNIPKQDVKAWTDSTVVLAWLNSHPSRWKTFVGNRVSEILTSIDSSQWFHVSTKDNAADIASRGILPSGLADHKHWLEGPQFLRNKEIIYTRPRDLEVHLEDDNGTTFVGAAKELQQLYALQMSAVEHLETHGTEWHFIPPHAPNFGGLWEAGVKSVKHHLKRIIGETTLTYEELNTLLIQIEASHHYYCYILKFFFFI
ncbi:hypothetical protein ABMA27_012488 [Loxostege sticticalis]|uniref:Peptidase aspartic putative domain-containing protein n=1 Tax=Loxostege sticticalis TaxID=481309 RepID=A0ABR3H1H6_LOXSC